MTTVATDAAGELGQALENLGPDEQRTIAFAALRATVARPPRVVDLRIVEDEDGYSVAVDGGAPTWRRSRPHAVLAALSDALPTLVGALLEGLEVRLVLGAGR